MLVFEMAFRTVRITVDTVKLTLTARQDEIFCRRCSVTIEPGVKPQGRLRQVLNRLWGKLPQIAKPEITIRKDEL